MFVRTAAPFASVALFVVSSGLAGCAAAPYEPSGTSASRLTGKGSSENGNGGKGETAEADEECVDTCNTSIKERCDGDATFCEDICRGTPKSQILCMANKTTCEKSEWIACAPEDSDTGGKPGASTGGKPGANTGGKPGADTGGKPGADTGGKPGADTGGKPGADTGGKPSGDDDGYGGK